MAHAFTPHRVEYPLQGPEGPASWVFYVVSQIDGQHRPLAVVIRQAITIANFEPSRGEDITPSCLRTLKIFSDPANRVAIESEVDIATGFYQESDNLSLPTAKLPDFMEFTRSYGIHSDWNMPEFPFVSTCLLLGVGLPPSMSMPRSGPLGTVYRDNDIRHGLVVVDITDLDNIRFGIIAFTVRLMVWDEGHEWNLEGPIGTPVPALENDRPRRPLSAAQYIAKFRYDSSPEVSELEKIPLINVSVMDHVWPLDSLSLSPITPDLAHHYPRSLRDQAIIALINSTLETERFEMSVFGELRAIPHFQDLLLRFLRERSESLGETQAAGQLLGIAFEGKTHLNMARFKGLSAQSIGLMCLYYGQEEHSDQENADFLVFQASLETEELKNAESISLCIDTIRSTPAQILDALSRSSSLHNLCFVASPTRANDQTSTALFLELSKRPHLLRGKITITGSYSAALNTRSWLPPTLNYQPHFEFFPIQHMFYCIGSRAFHYYLGDAFLGPKSFAAKFLKWINYPDGYMFNIAAGPPGLEDMSRTEISPIPAKNFSVPDQCGDNAEFRPGIRNLVPESWIILVSREKYVDKERNRLQMNLYLPTEARYTKYACVRPRVHIAVDDPTAVANLSPEQLEVGGLKEFLQATAPDVDSALVDQRLAELGQQIGNGYRQAPLGPGLEWLMVLKQDEACDMLRDFLSIALKTLNKS